jgi:TRAP transporter TAXI family solute receptor
LLSLDQDALQVLADNNPYYVPVTLPAKIYPGQDEPVRTLSVTAMLVANKDLPDDKVTQLLEAVFTNLGAISKAGFQASFIARAKAREGATIPLHPGAEQYYSKS